MLLSSKIWGTNFLYWAKYPMCFWSCNVINLGAIHTRHHPYIQSWYRGYQYSKSKSWKLPKLNKSDSNVLYFESRKKWKIRVTLFMNVLPKWFYWQPKNWGQYQFSSLISKAFFEEHDNSKSFYLCVPLLHLKLIISNNGACVFFPIYSSRNGWSDQKMSH